jgi:putative ABC transport system permease protein
MSLLDRKLIRDLRHLRGQILSVGLVMACGLAMMIMSRSLVVSLEENRDAYYEEHRFAHVFANLTRAPDSLAGEIAKIPGVAAVETSIARYATLDIPGIVEPAVGLINSLPDIGEKSLNRLFLRVGRLPESGGRREVVVSEPFAEANKLRPGDSVAAVIYGRRQVLRITGIVLSPEFVFESRPGAALPDNKTFGVFWMPYTELATAFNMDGAFDSVSIRLQPGASEPAVLAALDLLLAPYGGRRAFGRDNHPSHVRVRDEIETTKVLSLAYPLIFLSVAVFMINSVMNRQVALQRDQVAILKAFGFTNRQVGMHYMKFSLAIVLVGTSLGTLGGVALGQGLVKLFRQFYRFPSLDMFLDGGAIFAAAIACALAAIAGVSGAVRKAIRLAPAEAMRPEPPAHYRKALLERLGLNRLFAQSFRMSLRNIERKPVQALLTSLALAMATGLMVIPNSFRDGIDYVLNHQWDLLQRQTATLVLVEAGPARVVHDFENMPGVVIAEPFRSMPIELRAGHRVRRVSITGLQPGAELNRVMDADARRIPVGPGTFTISTSLAEALGVAAGATVEVRALEGRRIKTEVLITSLAEDFAGIAAYMELDSLNALLGDGDRVSGAHVLVAADSWEAFMQAVKETPQIGAVAVKESLRQAFRETTAQSMGIIQKIYLVFATTVAFGIVYNGARISLSERGRELATLRVIGFSRGEVGAVLVGELALLTLAALPLGLVLGSGAAAAITRLVNTEFIRMPLVLTPSNYAFAVLVVLVATALSALWASRRINQLDLVGVLKAQD